ncbi:cyanophycinase [Crocinitomicaceae bacterium]|nr:cyanophycinase [Crocinitomicaceae bacterium]
MTFTFGYAQNYTSYFTGNSTDLEVISNGGICLMGGSTEDDNGMRWFLERANGGDVLVIRTSGSDGYNDYLYSELGVNVNSVETIVFNNPSAANETYIHQKIMGAEAIWIAGGDQWNYISYWRNTSIDSLINEGIQNRNMAIGGTSAGMAILGGHYFSAQNGTVSSATALTNPFDGDVTVDHTPFIDLPILEDVVTDTHYDDPNRKGRHVVFMSRILNDHGVVAKGIACDEYTAVCIDENGIASVFGEHPDYDDYAYFLQVNCEYPFNAPETIQANTPLTWNMNGEALKVYFAPGTTDGSVQFDLNNWKEATGGSWQHWYVNNGTLIEHNGTQIDCGIEGIESLDLESDQIIGFYDLMGRKTDFVSNQLLLIRYADGKIIRHLKRIYSP